MKIIKRNGSEVDFDLNKIVVAVSKANAACRKEELTQSQIVEIAEYVEFKISKANRALSVEEIQDIVRKNEPSLALYADNEGLYYYEKIIKQAKKNLKEKFIIAFEIGYMQGDKIKKLAEQNYPKAEVVLKKDLQGKDRFIFIINN